MTSYLGKMEGIIKDKIRKPENVEPIAFGLAMLADAIIQAVNLLIEEKDKK